MHDQNGNSSATVETICFQDEIPVILNTSLKLKAYFKDHHVYKEVWTPEVGEKLNVLVEPDNRVDKFANCVAKDQTVVGHLRKGDLESSQRRIFDSSKVIPTVTAMLKFQGNNATWKLCKDGEGLPVPFKIIITGQKNM